MRLAWFSPMPPVPSGIAACSAELVDELAARHAIDVYVHDPDRTGPTLAGIREPVRALSAHDFVWRHRAEPVRPDGLPDRKLVAPRLYLAVSLPVSGLDRAARRALASRAGGVAAPNPASR